MSILLSLDSVSQHAGNKELFNSLKLAIHEGARVGIIGPNGSGKSTLLKIMAGLIEPDQGRVVARGGVRIALLQQMDNFCDEDSLITTAIKNLKNQLADDLLEVRAAKVLTRIGFSNLEQKVSELSGGWRKRLGLAIALAVEPDLLLLDEPTNHLDLAGLLWLEDLLLKEKTAWVLISHDRYFLERTVNEVIEISPTYPSGTFVSEGTYLDFLEKRDIFWEQENSRTASLANKVRNELEWASRGARGRTTKATARLKSTHNLHEQLKEIRSRTATKELEMAFTDSGRQTKDLVEFINVSFSFGDRSIIKKESFKVTQGMCLGILGQNGQGKSTLLKLIGGSLEAESGKIKQANLLKVVYFDQLRAGLSSARTLHEALSDGQEQVNYQGRSIAIISWARRFGFDINALNQPLKELSGGEQGRLLLSKLVRQEADLLILDEPTNDLDIPMLESLESMLVNFTGATVLVTHDRFMLEKVCSHYLGFDKQQKLLPFASYEQWQEYIFDQSNQPKNKTPNKADTPKTKLSDAERREYGQIENKILKAEKSLEAVTARAADPANHVNHQASQKISAELAEARAQIDLLYQRWSELEAKNQ